MIQVELKGNSVDDVGTATAVSFYAQGIAPIPAPVGSNQSRVGLRLLNRTTMLYTYDVVAWPFSIDDVAVSGADQDHGDLDALIDLLLSKHLWIASVTGTRRKNAAGADWWSTHSLPRKVVLIGDPRPSSSFDEGAMLYEFELRDQLPTYP